MLKNILKSNFVKVLFITLFLIPAAVYVSACGSDKNIKFDYFYRGFTAVSDNGEDNTAAALSQMIGGRIILTEEDWQDFMGKYCPGIPYYTQVDFTKECLAAEIINGAKPTYTASYDIKRITAMSDKLDIQGEFNISAGIYALNPDGYINYFLNIVKINKTDLPSNLNDIYGNL